MKHKNWMVLLLKEEPQKTYFNLQDAEKIAKKLGIDFTKTKFDLKQFQMGLNTELEHGSKFANTNITYNDPIMTAKIALAHLQEFPDYYTRLRKLENEAIAFWAKNQ